MAAATVAVVGILPVLSGWSVVRTALDVAGSVLLVDATVRAVVVIGSVTADRTGQDQPS